MWLLESGIWPWPSGSPRLDQLAAGGDDDDARAAGRHIADGAVGRREQPDLRGAEDRSRRAARVRPRRASSPARRMCWPSTRGLRMMTTDDAAVGPLELDDRVGAGRHRRAGHDARAEAGLDADAGVAAGGDVADHRQRDRRCLGGRRRDVVQPYRVAVHRRVVEAGQRARRRRRPRASVQPWASTSGSGSGGSGCTAAQHVRQVLVDGLHRLRPSRGSCRCRRPDRRRRRTPAATSRAPGRCPSRSHASWTTALR